MTWLLSPWLVFPALRLFASALIIWSLTVAGDDLDEPTADDDLDHYDDRWPEGWALCAEGHNGHVVLHSVNYQHKADAP